MGCRCCRWRHSCRRGPRYSCGGYKRISYRNGQA
nr:MAG TPA: hypothetical protein [Caudoviricetes sp.]